MLKKSVYVNKVTKEVTAKISGEYNGKVYVGRGHTQCKSADTFDAAVGTKVAKIKAYRNRLKNIRTDLVSESERLTKELKKVNQQIKTLNKQIDAETEKIKRY